MACNKVIAMLLISAFVVMASVEMGESLSDCGKAALPLCMKMEGTTLGVCENSVEKICEEAKEDIAAVKAKFNVILA